MSKQWDIGYIENAATCRRPIFRADGTLFTDKASNYDPPENGVHLCGQTDDGEQPTTVAAYPARRSDAAALWAVAKEVAECGRDEADFVVDLFVGGDVESDFWSNRQLWPRAISAWNARLEQERG
jgi:hypothetical protein